MVENGIRLRTGEVVEVDVIVCATGFDVSWKPRFPVIGRGGIDLADQWKDRPLTYLSFAVPNFPNYFGMSAFTLDAIRKTVDLQK